MRKLHSHLILLLLLTCVVFSGSYAPTSSANSESGADGDDRLIFGPYWTSKGGSETSVLVSNPLVDSCMIGVTVLDKDGDSIAEFPVVLGSMESATVNINQEVGFQSEGQLRITYPASVDILPAQILISNGQDASVIDFVSASEQAFFTMNRNAIFYSSPLITKTKYVLTNLGDDLLEGVADYAYDDRTNSRRWKLRPRETRVFNVPGHTPHQLSVGQLSISTDAPTEALVVNGWSEVRDGRVLPLRFGGAVDSSSGTVAGFHAEQALLSLWNLGDTDLVAGLRPDGEDTGILDVEVPAGQLVTVSLAEDLDLTTAGALAIDVPVGSRFIAQSLNFEDDMWISSFMDVGKETNLAYGFSVRLGEDLTSQVSIYNPNSETVAMCVFLYFGDERYTYPIKSLGPNEFAQLDFRDAQLQQIVGEMGNTIPLDAVDGQAKIVIHEEEGVRNLVVMGFYKDIANRTTISLQGCFVCPPTLIGANLEPLGGLSGPAGGTVSYEVVATFSDFSQKYVTTDLLNTSASTTNSAVATAFAGTVSLHSPGFATLVAAYTGCAQYTFGSGGGGLGEREPCECEFTTTESAHPSLSIESNGIKITGPSTAGTGVETSLTTVTFPTGGTFQNLRVVNDSPSQGDDDPECIKINGVDFTPLAPGQVDLCVEYTVAGQTYDSCTVQPNGFPVTLTANPQFIRVIWSSAADTILNGKFTAAQVQSIKNRVDDNLEELFVQEAGANVIIGASTIPGLPTQLIHIRGNGSGGTCGFDLLNDTRIGTCFVYIGVGSLDVGSSVDPDGIGPDNERNIPDRVADAISRLSAHEAGHALGLVAVASEVANHPLAIKLNVQNLLNGVSTSSRHNPDSGSNSYIMYFSSLATNTETWYLDLTFFKTDYETYLDRILP